jgi:hypothetical protein
MPAVACAHPHTPRVLHLCRSACVCPCVLACVQSARPPCATTKARAAPTGSACARTPTPGPTATSAWPGSRTAPAPAASTPPFVAKVSAGARCALRGANSCAATVGCDGVCDGVHSLRGCVFAWGVWGVWGWGGGESKTVMRPLGVHEVCGCVCALGFGCGCLCLTLSACSLGGLNRRLTWEVAVGVGGVLLVAAIVWMVCRVRRGTKRGSGSRDGIGKGSSSGSGGRGRGSSRGGCCSCCAPRRSSSGGAKRSRSRPGGGRHSDDPRYDPLMTYPPAAAVAPVGGGAADVRTPVSGDSLNNYDTFFEREAGRSDGSHGGSDGGDVTAPPGVKYSDTVCVAPSCSAVAACVVFGAGGCCALWLEEGCGQTGTSCSTSFLSCPLPRASPCIGVSCAVRRLAVMCCALLCSAVLRRDVVQFGEPVALPFSMHSEEDDWRR